MGLDCRQMDDVFANKTPWNVKAVRVYVVQAKKLVGEIADRITNVDPFLSFIKMDVSEAVALNYVDLFVLSFTKVSIYDNGSIVTGMDKISIVAILEHRPNHPVKLPRRSRGARVEKVPRDVDLERGIDHPINNLLVTS